MESDGQQDGGAQSPHEFDHVDVSAQSTNRLDPAQTTDRIQNQPFVELGLMSPEPSAGLLDSNNKANNSFILAANGIVTSSPEVY